MKRPITLTALILGLSINAIFMIPLIIGLSTLKHLSLCIFFGVLVACVVCAIVFSAISIRAWNKDFKGYKKCANEINCALAFNFVGVAGAIITIILGVGIWVIFLSVLEIIAGITSSVLLIVDLAIEGKRQKKTQEADFQNKNNQPALLLQDKLAKLIDMKERRLITDDEFKSIKAKYVKDEKPKTKLELQMEKLEDMKARGLITEEEYKSMRIIHIKEQIGK